MLQQILSFLNTPLSNEELESHAPMVQVLSEIKEAQFSTFTKPRRNHGENGDGGGHRHRPNSRKRYDHSRRRHNGFARNVNQQPAQNGFERRTHQNPSQNQKPNNWRENRYMSMYSKKAKDENEKHFNNITDKLGKITKDNFEELVSQIYESLTKIDDDTTKKFVNELFNRAAMQPIFCEIYVNILARCTGVSPNIQKYITEIIDDYLELFNTKITKISPDNYEEYCQNNKEKDYRIGYSSFIGELLGSGLVSSTAVYRFATTIFEEIKKETEIGCSKEAIQDNIGCFKNLIMKLMGSNDETVQEMKQALQGAITEYLSPGRPVLRRKIGMKSIFSLEDLLKL
jgi:hypothetical protein